MRKRYTVKEIFLSYDNWAKFLARYKHRIRFAIIYTISKLLTCRNTIRGYHQYRCSNPDCNFTKKIAHTCKSKACSSCGKKDIEIWTQKQNNILPNTPWQHITFTMPQQLWDFFWLNRYLFNFIAKAAADCIKTIADKKNATAGIFIALHTFKRNLGRNVHIHLSTTTGGISKDSTTWIKLFFSNKKLEGLWKYKIIKLFRDAYKSNRLNIPGSTQKTLNRYFTFYNFLDELFRKNWIVNCGKESENHQRNIDYFGRYTKRPPIAESKIKHFDEQTVIFTYRNHKTGKYEEEKLSVFEFIKRFVQHIPDLGFRMIRYYGFLANRVRGKFLKSVYKLIGHTKKANLVQTHFATLIHKNFGYDPLSCSKCGSTLLLSFIKFGQSNTHLLMKFHASLHIPKNI
jgi:ssDNA-binding Zn-finger/Zn-ribbon topoisomerase 1